MMMMVMVMFTFGRVELLSGRCSRKKHTKQHKNCECCPMSLFVDDPQFFSTATKGTLFIWIYLTTESTFNWKDSFSKTLYQRVAQACTDEVCIIQGELNCNGTYLLPLIANICSKEQYRVGVHKNTTVRPWNKSFNWLLQVSQQEERWIWSTEGNIK